MITVHVIIVFMNFLHWYAISTKVHDYALFRVNDVFYECLIFYKVKKIEINYLTLTLIDDFKD